MSLKGVNTWQITEVSNSTRRHADNSGNQCKPRKICHSTIFFNGWTLLNSPPYHTEWSSLHEHEWSDKKGRVTELRTAKRQIIHIFVRQESGRLVTTSCNFEIGGDTIKTMEIVHGWQCQCMQWNKDIFPIRKQILGNLLLFVAFLYFKSVANLFYSRVKRFPSSRGFRNSVCFIINHKHAYEVNLF